jgi:hypothetical protein
VWLLTLFVNLVGSVPIAAGPIVAPVIKNRMPIATLRIMIVLRLRVGYVGQMDSVDSRTYVFPLVLYLVLVSNCRDEWTNLAVLVNCVYRRNLGLYNHESV